jgi:hypothetical protein
MLSGEREYGWVPLIGASVPLRSGDRSDVAPQARTRSTAKRHPKGEESEIANDSDALYRHVEGQVKTTVR